MSNNDPLCAYCCERTYPQSSSLGKCYECAGVSKPKQAKLEKKNKGKRALSLRSVLIDGVVREVPGYLHVIQHQGFYLFSVKRENRLVRISRYRDDWETFLKRSQAILSPDWEPEKPHVKYREVSRVSKHIIKLDGVEYDLPDPLRFCITGGTFFVFIQYKNRQVTIKRRGRSMPELISYALEVFEGIKERE